MSFENTNIRKLVNETFKCGDFNHDLPCPACGSIKKDYEQTRHSCHKDDPAAKMQTAMLSRGYVLDGEWWKLTTTHCRIVCPSCHHVFFETPVPAGLDAWPVSPQMPSMRR